MPKLNQILAVERGVKTTSNQILTERYHLLQKPVLLQGISRVYSPLDDEGEQFPPESQRVQVRVDDVLRDVQTEFGRLWDVVATKDWANTRATADVVVDGATLITGAPTTYLLWLEKQLTDLHTVVKALPTLDPGEDWSYSENQSCYEAAPRSSNKSKKVPRVLTKAPATDKHQADTEVWYEDVVVGTWTTTHYSGALPAQTVRDTLERINNVREAVRVARQEANSSEVTNQTIAAPVLSYVFSG